VPPATLDAFLDHGKPAAAAIKEDLGGAKRQVAEFAAVGLDLSRVCHGLLDDGVKSFITSMKTLLDAVGGRRAALLETAAGRQKLSLPDGLQRATDAAVAKLVKDRALARIWEADASFFSSDSSHERSIKSRLGWLRAPALMQTKRAELEAFAADVSAAGYTGRVLLGMGGSSLWPEVVSQVWGLDKGLDAARPGQHRSGCGVGGRIAGGGPQGAVRGRVEVGRHHRDPGVRTPLLAATLGRSGNDVARAGASFAAITDPATRLGQLAEEKHYRRVFINPADIGGRYSALSFFVWFRPRWWAPTSARWWERARSSRPPRGRPSRSPRARRRAGRRAGRGAGQRPRQADADHLAGHRQLRLVDRAAGRGVVGQGRQRHRPDRSRTGRKARELR
jgi:transaldolase/glucose-6-phosphate isomerase